MTMLDDLNNFRSSLLTKTVIDRKKKITTSREGEAVIIGPEWPEVTFSLNHINHAHYREGLGPHLFQVAFGMVHKVTGLADLMDGSMLVASITMVVPPAPSSTAPPVVTIALGSGKQITFACGSIAITPKKR